MKVRGGGREFPSPSGRGVISLVLTSLPLALMINRSIG